MRDSNKRIITNIIHISIIGIWDETSFLPMLLLLVQPALHRSITNGQVTYLIQSSFETVGTKDTAQDVNDNRHDFSGTRLFPLSAPICKNATRLLRLMLRVTEMAVLPMHP